MKNNNTVFTDLVCFSHLRWNFVFQRPQHLLSRFAKHFRVFYVEEPIAVQHDDKLMIRKSDKNVWVIVPHLKDEGSEEEKNSRQKNLLSDFFNLVGLHNYIFWYYTPLALSVSDHFNPKMIVYDCMDELSAFKNASPLLKEKEKEMLKYADIVFTGGYSLFEAKKHLHKYVYPFPSSIDKEHFCSSRTLCNDPADQVSIPHPRIGFYGVIDERFDIELIEEVAKRKTDWQFVIIGPVVKINPASLPRLENIHYLGGKSYGDLPLYLSGWDVAMIPFARNESTRFISPTKTPEYLAAGKPVVSTSIKDVVDPYEKKGLVFIADTPDEFINAIQKAFAIKNDEGWLNDVDEFLASNSWDETWKYMISLMVNKLYAKNSETIITKKEKVYV
jgi:glycosyltransferase involved in cell wall biosynthesis